MSINIQTCNSIKKMRAAGKIAANVLEMIEPYVKANITTGEINDLCHKYITEQQNAISAPLGYKGFPKSVCISINDVVCHGIPSYKKKLKNGDIVNIDVTVIKDGFHGDTSKMYFVGQPSILAKRLCDITQKSMYLAICIIRPGIRLNTIGKTIQQFIEKEKFSIVREYCGHGIGQTFHEDPQILHYDADDNGIILKEGMAFTIEPMINVGNPDVRVMKDGWTVKTKDHSLSAQYEHTIVVTNDGCEIMTLRTDDTLPSIIHH